MRDVCGVGGGVAAEEVVWEDAFEEAGHLSCFFKGYMCRRIYVDVCAMYLFVVLSAVLCARAGGLVVGKVSYVGKKDWFGCGCGGARWNGSSKIEKCIYVT